MSDAAELTRNDVEISTADGRKSTRERDAKTRQNYLLLQNYVQSVVPMRELLIATSLHNIEQIDSDAFPLYRHSDVEKAKAKSMFQMEMILGIMLYIEDLIVLSESFRRRVLYHELLDGTDVGQMIKKFFQDLGSFSDEEFRRIFGYADPAQVGLKEGERELVAKVMQKNIEELKRIFTQIGKFSTTHHPAFRRFKHGGAPMMLGSEARRGGDDFFAKFDSHTAVLVDKKPFKDVIFIPLSKDVLKGYNVVVDGIYLCLNDLTRNHIARIERNLDGVIPTNRYFNDYLSKDEADLYAKIIKKFYDKHQPHTEGLRDYHYESVIEKEKIEWYLDLPEFLTECKTRAERVWEYDVRL